MCFVVTCWERADLLALVCGVFCEFVTFPLVSWVRCGTWLYRFLIFAPLLTFTIYCLRPCGADYSLMRQDSSLIYILKTVHRQIWRQCIDSVPRSESSSSKMYLSHLRKRKERCGVSTLGLRRCCLTLHVCLYACLSVCQSQTYVVICLNMRGSRKFCQRCSNLDNVFFSWWGEGGSKYHFKRAIIGPPAKRH